MLKKIKEIKEKATEVMDDIGTFLDDHPFIGTYAFCASLGWVTLTVASLVTGRKWTLEEKKKT